MKRPIFTALHSFLFMATLLLTNSIYAENSKRGQITGGVMHEAPSWFKESFLEIRDDVDEAAEADKHVVLFFQLNACPYCDRMLRESFETEPLTSFIQQHFDAISINVRGDREVVFNAELSVTEKELSEVLNVRATTAIVYLDHNNKTVARVDGYRSPQRFQQIVEYVSSKAYEQDSLSDYLERNLAKNIYQPRDNPIFQSITDLSSVDGPMAVIFEDGSCYDCGEFHDKILGRPIVQKELEAFTLVRLNTDSSQRIIDTEGNETTAKGLADKYQMIYRPGVLLFDQGELIRRYDSLLFPHHFKEGFRYVAGGYYKTEDYDTYSEKRTEELLSSGVDIDLSPN
ncbi:MAG: thioredoxin fold domain-containing protein [Gammaproteobacteria bacterium]